MARKKRTIDTLKVVLKDLQLRGFTEVGRNQDSTSIYLAYPGSPGRLRLSSHHESSSFLKNHPQVTHNEVIPWYWGHEECATKAHEIHLRFTYGISRLMDYSEHDE